MSLTLLLTLCAATAAAQESIGWDGDDLMRVSIDTVKELAEVSDDPLVMIVVAVRYLEGIGVDGSMDEGVRWSRRAAERGSVAGAMLWGGYLMAFSEEVADHIEAYAWLKITASCGGEDAIEGLDLTAELLDSEQIKAAALRSEEILGEFFPSGVNCDEMVTPRLTDPLLQVSIDAAVELAEVSDNPFVMIVVAVRYLEGIGVDKSMDEFAHWTRRAAEHGTLTGALLWGSYLIGFGDEIANPASASLRNVPERDERATYIEGYAWLKIVAACGSEQAIEVLEVAADYLLDGEEIAVAERRSAEILEEYFGSDVACAEEELALLTAATTTVPALASPAAATDATSRREPELTTAATTTVPALPECLPDCSGEDLRGADLRGADLSWANLTSANLTDAVLAGADLIGADLTSADLRGADLRDANSIGAILKSADLRDADLRGADLRGVNLAGADLRGASLHMAKMRGAVLVGAHLAGAILAGADLAGGFLTSADLSEADLSEATLRGAILTGADLTDASLNRAVLIAAILSVADLTGADLTGADLTDAVLTRANLTDAVLRGPSLYAAIGCDRTSRLPGCGNPDP